MENSDGIQKKFKMHAVSLTPHARHVAFAIQEFFQLSKNALFIHLLQVSGLT
jgi:hypothetical protein